MNSWTAIEAAVRSVLAGLTQGESGLLATVKGQTWRERKAVLAALARERLPAAYVLTVGRDTGEKELRRPGRHLVNVWLAERSLRSEQEGWSGGEEVTGLLTLAARVAEALEGSIVDGDRRLRLIDEQPVSGPVGLLVWEQRYALSRQAEMVAPTFAGRALAGADSEMRVELGPLVRAGSYFAFPGVNGVFERNLGLRQRSIIWRGRLRASDDAALNAIEADIEGELADGQAGTMIDAWGRSHGSCVIKSYKRVGPRGRDELDGSALQDSEIEFVQLLG